MWTDDTVQGRHGPIPIRRYSTAVGPHQREPLVWVHGGAFAYGGLEQPESHAPAVLIADAGRDVITVDYRRVPRWDPLRDPKPGTLTGTRFPIPMDDVTDVVRHVIHETVDARVALGGASAGACLAVAATLSLHRAGSAAPSRLVLAYGTFHAELPTVPAAIRRRISGLRGLTQFRAATVRRMNLNYAGSPHAMSDPLAFPGGHELEGLPPTLLVDADRDSLRASGAAFATELRQAGVPVHYTVVPGSPHGFLNRPRTEWFHRGAEAIMHWLDFGTIPPREPSPTVARRN